MKYIFFALMLTGCVSMVETAYDQIPSTKYCSKVSYDRTGKQIVIYMECEAP